MKRDAHVTEHLGQIWGALPFADDFKTVKMMRESLNEQHLHSPSSIIHFFPPHWTDFVSHTQQEKEERNARQEDRRRQRCEPLLDRGSGLEDCEAVRGCESQRERAAPGRHGGTKKSG